MRFAKLKLEGASVSDLHSHDHVNTRMESSRLSVDRFPDFQKFVQTRIIHARAADPLYLA